MEGTIRKAVEEALNALGAKGGSVAFTVERPADAMHGDYATNVALIAAKLLKRSPLDLADELVRELSGRLGGRVSKIDVAGPGFVNITLSADAVRAAVTEADAEDTDWGKAKPASGGSPDASRSDAFRGQRVMVEYTDPNPFKQMHIGHLMSNTIGEAITRLVENEGATIARACYQGDVGPHVAKAIWGLQKIGLTEPTTAQELGEAYAHGAQAYEADAAVKKEIDALNVAIYEGKDEALMALWRRGRQVALDAFEPLYRRLGTHFDYYFYESESSTPGMELVRDGLKKGVFEESEGAIIYRGEKKGLHTLVFITSRGTPTYDAKELGLAFLKEERWPSDRSIIVTGHEQIGHFAVVKAAFEDMEPALARKTVHVPHGLLRLAEGKMSSRLGNVITAESLLKDVTEKALEKNADPVIAEQVAVGAIKFMVLRQAPGQDIVFDFEKSLSLSGDSGPYLQYALVRAAKILAYESEDAGGAEVPEAPYALERIILHYPEVAARAARELAPNLLVTYLLELAAAWNSFYASEQILGSPEEQYKQRVARAFAHTMANGLALLGIPAPERM